MSDSHVLVLKTDGTLWAWGYGSFGQIGDGAMGYRLAPVQVGSDTDWVGAAAGRFHSIGRKTDGSLWGWGYGGLVGDGTTVQRNTPVRID